MMVYTTAKLQLARFIITPSVFYDDRGDSENIYLIGPENQMDETLLYILLL